MNKKQVTNTKLSVTDLYNHLNSSRNSSEILFVKKKN